MSEKKKRIAIHTDGEYCPGLGCIVSGALLAAHELSWELVAIHDGYAGLLFPERYPDGGTFELDVHVLARSSEGRLGGSPLDPCSIDRRAGAPGPVGASSCETADELERSEELLERLRDQHIDAVIGIVGRRALSVAWKLQRKGLPTLCVPVSAENDLAGTGLSFGFSTTLACTVDLLDRARQAAVASRRLAVVEVPGQSAGWLALQAGMAALADAIFIPELSSEVGPVAAALSRRRERGLEPGLVVVAEGVPLPAGEPRRPERCGAAAQTLALELQRRLAIAAFPLALGSLLRGGPPNATDRQLGIAYGAAAIHGIRHGQNGSLVAFRPPKLDFVPLGEAVHHTRLVPPDSQLLEAARTLGIALGGPRGSH